MVALLHRPLSPLATTLVTAGLVLATALYCLTYSALLGRADSAAALLLWPLINIVPWFLAFEAGKRAHPLVTLGTAFLVSMLLGIAWGGADNLAFESARRVPAVLLVGLLLVVGRRTLSAKERVRADAAELPLNPDQIDWVAAAGNYVEIRSGGRTLVERASLAAIEQRLGRHGFVRIHRSTLVRRDRIARIRPADVILADGTSLKTGKRYRAGLAMGGGS